LAFTICLSPLAAQRTYDCGNEGQPACGWKDWEHYNMRYWTKHGCEPDLENQDGTCVNSKRRTWSKTLGWLGWALSQQLYGISKDQPINRIPWLGSHNAFSNVHQGFGSGVYTNHYYSITDQLNIGVRHLELDPHHYGGAGRNAIRLCHASSTDYCRIPGYATRLFGFALKEIADWLKANPGEVIVVKLNDKNLPSDNYQELYNELNTYLGSVIYKPPTTFTRWPTIHEIRSAGKQILFMMHDKTPPAGNGWVWNARGYVLDGETAKNWPRKQDFDQCIASDFVYQIDRAPNAWWDVAEGRSKLNINDVLFGDNYTGFLEEDDVRRAAACGVNIIGLDFLYALWSNFNVDKRESPPDDRVRYSIWNWAPNDYGQNGPAALQSNSRRWFSRPAAQIKRLACAKVGAYGNSNDERGWRITTQAYSWNLAIGNAACSTEFNTPTQQYEFAFPRNAYQNRRLTELLGPDNEIWLGYSLTGASPVALQPSQITFTIAPNGAPPPPITARFYGPAGSGFQLYLSQPWIAKPTSLPTSIPQEGFVDIPVGLAPEASALTPGAYIGNLRFRAVHGGNPQYTELPFDIKLVVKGPSQITLTPRANPVAYNTAVELRANLSSPLNGFQNANVVFVRTSDPNPDNTAVTTPATGAEVNANMGVLPPGIHRFAATFTGGDRHLQSESAEISVTVLPRIVVTPSSASFSVIRGGSLPALQSLALTGFSTALAAASTCPWLAASPEPAQSRLQLAVTSNATLLAPGAHECNVTVSDGLSATQGSTVIPVTLRMLTTISAYPTSLQALTSTALQNGSVSVMADPTNANIPIVFSTNRSWIQVNTQIPSTPTSLAIAMDPTGLPPGVHQGVVQVRSDFATNVLDIPVTLTVVRPTVITSTPPGLQVSVDNTPVTTPASFIWAPGSSHFLTLNTTQVLGDVRYRFAAWSDGGAQGHSIVANQNGGTYTVSFTESYRLRADVAPTNGGSITPVPNFPDGFYPSGTTVQLTAANATGFNFAGWSGALTGAQPTGSVLMNAPKYVTAAFTPQDAVAVRIESNAPGTRITMDGAPVDLPVTLQLVVGRRYRFAAPGQVTETDKIRWAFQIWNVPGSNVVDYTPTAPATLTIRYQRQVYLTVTASPSGAGAAGGEGWYAPLATGYPVVVQATPNTGYRFSGFSGALTGTTNPQTIVVTDPVTVIANFAPSAQAQLFATTGGPRIDVAPGQRLVPIMLRNAGQGAATGAAITSVTGIATIAGSGAVSLASPLPVGFGDIAPGGAATQPLLFNWPATATRVQFTVSFTANGGAYSGSTTLTLFR
ncbi:MAG: hypothetical protein JNK48_15020, partial [Bryobacterales bacterium]|nr:hypothetical protein [Bryobacterales bacterium]